jgi:hypothetical protein
VDDGAGCCSTAPCYQQVGAFIGPSRGQCGQLKHQYKAGDNRIEKLLLTVWEAADVLSVSRSRVYELLYAEQPVWTGAGYCDPDTGVMLPTWRQALDHLDADPDAGPVHVMRFGTQHDIAGIIAPSADADRAVRYLAKYLASAIGDPLGDNSESDPAREAHIDRLHAELRWLPCSPRCANWLRYGIQLDRPSPGLSPGRCSSKAHDREHLGIGGRRVLVSRDWSGKTLCEHRADRSAVVREALQSAGMAAPDLERMATDVLSPRRTPPLRVDRRTPRPHHLHPDAPTGSRRTTTLARTIRPGQDQNPRLRLWTVFRQSARPAAADRPVPRLPTAWPHPITRQIQGRRTGSQG